MNNYYTGTSAYKLEEYEIYAQKSREKQQQRKIASKADHRAVCRLMIASVLVVFTLAASLVYVNVMALRASSDIVELEKQLAMVVDDNKNKEIEINKKLDMKVIEKKAVEKLGMQKPDNGQIIYVDVKKANSTEVKGETTKEESKTLLMGIKTALNNIEEYFN